MRILAALAALLLTSSSAAQDVRAPVNVLTRLYVDCIKVEINSPGLDITPTRVGIAEFVEAVDDKCLTWTVIWYPALLGTPVQSLPNDTITRFNGNRLRTLQQLTNELRTAALK